MQSSVISLKEIQKTYPFETKPVLCGCSLDIFPQDIIGIYGASGSGKSTLLRIIGLCDFDYQGSLYIQNTLIDTQNIKAISDIRRQQIGFIFQDFKLIMDKTIRENLDWVCALSRYTRKESKRRINATFYQVSLPLSFLDKYPYQLSGGQQQRVAIARTLLKQPQFIIADEPTGSLDNKNKHEIFTLIQSLKIPCIIATHDDDTQAYCSRIFTMNQGQAYETLPPQTL